MRPRNRDHHSRGSPCRTRSCRDAGHSLKPAVDSSTIVYAGRFSLTPSYHYVPVVFMPAAQPSAPTTDPNPPRAGIDIPGRLGRVLSLVRKLIDYGKQLAGRVQLRAAAPGFALFAKPFGTADLAVIFARIAGGLRRAAAL